MKSAMKSVLFFTYLATILNLTKSLTIRTTNPTSSTPQSITAVPTATPDATLIIRQQPVVFVTTQVTVDDPNQDDEDNVVTKTREKPITSVVMVTSTETSIQSVTTTNLVTSTQITIPTPVKVNNNLQQQQNVKSEKPVWVWLLIVFGIVLVIALGIFIYRKKQIAKRAISRDRAMSARDELNFQLSRRDMMMRERDYDNGNNYSRYGGGSEYGRSERGGYSEYDDHRRGRSEYGGDGRRGRPQPRESSYDAGSNRSYSPTRTHSW